MPPMTRDGFARRVRGLSRDGLARLVADLWRARGRAVRREAGAVVATDPATGTVERLWVGPGRAPPDADAVDRVVTVAKRRRWSAPGGPPTVDVDALYELLRFAVDRDDADAIARAHLGRPFVVEPPPGDAAEEGVGPSPGDRAPSTRLGAMTGLPGQWIAGRPRSRVLFAVGAGLLLLLGVLGATGSPIGPTGAPAADGSTPTTEAEGLGTLADATATPTPVAGRAARAVETPSDPTDPWGPWRESRLAVRKGPLPSGLDPDGVTDPDALAESHIAAVDGRSYSLEITHREFVNGHPTAVARERVTVVSPTHYRSTVERAGPLRNDPLVIADHSAYADGSYRFERLTSHRGTAYLRRSPTLWDDGPTGRDRYAARVGSYIRWFLSVNESRISGVTDRDGVRYYWVVTKGETFPGYRNATGSALVDENGVVYELERSYDVPGQPGVSVRSEVRYDGFGEVTVTPPPWAETARNETVPPAWRTATPAEPDAGNATGPVGSTPAPTATPTPDRG